MKNPGRRAAELRRTLLAFALAYLFALQSLVSAVAFCCPASDQNTAFEAALASAICAHADDGQASASDKQAPAPVHSHHCLLCAAHAGCAPGVAASAQAFVPARIRSGARSLSPPRPASIRRRAVPAPGRRARRLSTPETNRELALPRAAAPWIPVSRVEKLPS